MLKKRLITPTYTTPIYDTLKNHHNSDIKPFIKFMYIYNAIKQLNNCFKWLEAANETPIFDLLKTRVRCIIKPGDLTFSPLQSNCKKTAITTRDYYNQYY